MVQSSYGLTSDRLSLKVNIGIGRYCRRLGSKSFKLLSCIALNNKSYRFAFSIIKHCLTVKIIIIIKRHCLGMRPLLCTEILAKKRCFGEGGGEISCYGCVFDSSRPMLPSEKNSPLSFFCRE